MDWLPWVREVQGTDGTVWLNIQVILGYVKIHTINSAATELLKQKKNITFTFQHFLIVSVKQFSCVERRKKKNLLKNDLTL